MNITKFGAQFFQRYVRSATFNLQTITKDSEVFFSMYINNSDRGAIEESGKKTPVSKQRDNVSFNLEIPQSFYVKG